MPSGTFKRNADRAAKLFDGGDSRSQIAKKMGVTLEAVYQYLRVTGRSESKPHRRFTGEDLKLAMSRGFKTASTAAEVIGCSPETVRMLAKESGIVLEADDSRGDQRRERLTQAARLHMGGSTLEELAEALDVKPATAREYLIHLGLMETRQQALERKHQKVLRLLEATNLKKGEIAAGVGLHPSQLSRLLKREEAR